MKNMVFYLFAPPYNMPHNIPYTKQPKILVYMVCMITIRISSLNSVRVPTVRSVENLNIPVFDLTVWLPVCPPTIRPTSTSGMPSDF